MPKYASWELGFDTDVPKVFVGLLADYEVCFIALGRARVGLKEAAETFGLDLHDLREMLHGRTPCVSLTMHLIEEGLL